jgi:flagellar biosynthesis/type III secretory pathway protein FliH
VPDDTGRGFASTSWLQPEVAGFSEGGFQPKSAGFAQDRYQTVSMPLSEKSKTTLKLMGDSEGLEDLAVEGVPRHEPESPNAHLPFVMDVYGVKPVAKKASEDTQVTEVASEATDANAHAEHDEERESDAQAAEHATDDPAQPELSEQALQVQEAEDVRSDVHALEPESEQVEEPQAQEAAHATEQAAESEENLAPEHDVVSEPQAQPEPEPDLAESELITDESAGEPQALAAEVDELLAQAPVPSVEVVGIDPEEVAQREAAQFAQGLAQGIEQGERQAREAMQQELAAQCAVLSAVTHDLNALLQDPKKFFEPLKRLALHVAEHVVMKELSTSTEAIERLVQRCLDELDHPAKGAVVVELNPQDKERLQAQDSALVAGMRLDAVQGMKPGSVRVFANDTVVEDLVEHRLEALARSLLVDVENWRAKSTLAQPEVEVSEPEVEDVEPNDVHS